jgi:hypothetical protein
MTQAVDKVQVYDNEYGGRCDTFGCDGNPIVNVGRPDAIHLSTKLCEKCIGELVSSVNERYLETPSTLDFDGALVDFLLSSGIKTKEDFDLVLAASVKTNSEITSTEEAMESLMMEPKDDDDNATVTLLLTDKEETEGVDLDEVLEAARTHAEVDTVVKEFGFEGIPTKADGATLAERKAAIIATFDDLVVE